MRGLLDSNGGSRNGGIVSRLRALHPGLPSNGVRIVRRVGQLAEQLRHAPPADPAGRDRLLSQGERIAAHWFAARLKRRGIPAVPVEADHLGLITDNVYGASRILLEQSVPAARPRLRSLLRSGRVPVITGFFGRSLEGRVATLGRGGSDYSAAAIGALVGAARVELIKRNVAIFTADPRLVPAARRIARLSYEEAEEFAQFGARVLHPVAIEPARWGRLELRVQSLLDPKLVTSIGPARRHAGIRSVTRLGPLRIVSVRVAGGRARPGIMADISGRLAAAGINLSAVVTTEAVIGLLVEPSEGRRAYRTLRPLSDAAGVVVGQPVPVSLVSVVGEGILAHVPAVPTWVLSAALGVLATGRSISIVVPEALALRAVRALHRAFVESRAG